MKTMPWPLRFGYWEMMENTKVVEKERGEFGEVLKVIGLGKKAWPFCCLVPLVRAKRPLGVNSATPSTVRFDDRKPLKVKPRSSLAAKGSSRRRHTGVAKLRDMTVSLAPSHDPTYLSVSAFICFQYAKSLIKI
ncbi:hypothetical protein LOK49_LG05G00456 [Camellia lanceoleosa]|uniref:Uncharacterized protein n=1 Tax=Camellia lanceoleosa TaxID=1840588 RepID=A0ACC0HLJ4_9ERIC|nr:hypothetical protein LOK49_LG05G00456 [Camellia lanceoleosa]